MAEGSEREILAHARAQLNAGELAPAVEACQRVLKRNKRAVEALYLLGLAASKIRQYDDAAKYFEKCVRLRPDHPGYRFLLGKVHTFRGAFEAAMKAYDAALALDRDHVDAIGWKAATHERMGAHDEARALLAPLVVEQRENPDMAQVWGKLEMKAGRCREAVDVLDRHLNGAQLPPTTRQLLLFLKGSALEKAGEYDNAFDAYRQANESMRVPFDSADWVTATDRIIAAFSDENLAKLSRAEHDSASAVFIAGLPRSGTTLIEQIIDAHPKGHGASETRELAEIAVSLPGLIGSQQEYPECVAELTQNSVNNLGKRYLNRTGRLNRNAARIVNKSIENYKLLGLVSLLLPEAKIIHCRRDPLDTCLSCFANHLTVLAYPWSTDLRHIAVAYRQYERLMRHWRDVLDVDILDLAYEDVIADQEAMTRRIIEFCGLEWDDRCLQYHKSGRFAQTLSYDQVRQPVYDSSVGRWKRFKRHLTPLREALEQAD